MTTPTPEWLAAERAAGTPWKVLERETGLSRQRLHDILMNGQEAEFAAAVRQARAALKEGGFVEIQVGGATVFLGMG